MVRGAAPYPYRAAILTERAERESSGLGRTRRTCPSAKGPALPTVLIQCQGPAPRTTPDVLVRLLVHTKSELGASCHHFSTALSRPRRRSYVPPLARRTAQHANRTQQQPSPGAGHLRRAPLPRFCPCGLTPVNPSPPATRHPRRSVAVVLKREEQCRLTKEFWTRSRVFGTP